MYGACHSSVISPTGLRRMPIRPLPCFAEWLQWCCLSISMWLAGQNGWNQSQFIRSEDATSSQIWVPALILGFFFYECKWNLKMLSSIFWRFLTDEWLGTCAIDSWMQNFGTSCRLKCQAAICLLVQWLICIKRPFLHKIIPPLLNHFKPNRFCIKTWQSV